jgi:hypothetical protein
MWVQAQDSPDMDVKRNRAWQMDGRNSVPVVDPFEHDVVFSNFLKSNHFLASNINISKRNCTLE